jgi:hypothetical protein
MSGFGTPQFLTAAVQVIPILAVVVVADSFIQRDAADRVHRLYASNAVFVGLLFGIWGEVAGLQALLTGPARNTIPNVDAGLMALGAAALVPRLAELMVPLYSDVARRVAQRLLPTIIAAVGLVFISWRGPLAFRVIAYVTIAMLLTATIQSFWGQPLTDRAAPHRSQQAEPPGRSGEQDSSGSTRPSAGADAGDRYVRSARPAGAQQPSMPRRSARWWVLASVAGIAFAIGMGRRDRHRR